MLLLLFTIGSTWFAVAIVKSFRNVPKKRHRDLTEEEVIQSIDPTFFN